MLVASAGLVTSLVLQHTSDRQQRDAVAKILPIVDTGFVTCVLGGPVADAELGPKLLAQEMSGALTASKVRACGELAVQKLAPFEGLRHELRPKLDTFWDDGLIAEEDDFGVCARLELVRTAANDLGVAVPPPSCPVKIETLEPVETKLPVPTVEHDLGDKVVLDEESDMGRHVVHWTSDGTHWSTSEPITSYLDLVVESGGIFAHADGRVVVLSGEHWSQGLAVPRDAGWAIDHRRTDSGWTLLWQLTGDDALVWRLDPMMSKVLATTAIPGLHKKWTNDAHPLGAIAADGTVGALRLRRTGDAIEIEAHVVHPDGKVDAPRVTRLPARGEIETETCHAPGATYLAIKGAGTVVTRDGGVTFTVLRGGDGVFPVAIACSDQHLVAAGDGRLMICDQAECRSQVTPHRSGQSYTTRVAMRGESARILVTDLDLTALFRVDPGSTAPAFVRAWRWSNIDIPALVRAEDTWFVMQ